MSRLPFELFLAFRYLRPKRTSISIITVISILGVVLGVAVLIIVISVMSGFDREWHERILGFNAHLKIVRLDASMDDALMENYEEILGIVARQKLVKAVAPFVMGKVLAETQPAAGASLTDAPVLRGVDPIREEGVSVIPRSIKSGAFDVSGNGIVIGTEFADNMRLHVGDRLLITSPRSLLKMREKVRNSKDGDVSEAFLPDEYTVRGIFDVGFADYNEMFVITSLENAQDIYDISDAVHGLYATMEDPYQAEEAARAVIAAVGPEYNVVTWMKQYERLFGALVLEKNMIFFLLFFIVLVAAFGITNSLITFVVQKTREVGMLKALGATRAQVIWLFLSQSVMVGVVGVGAGLGLGLLALKYRQPFLEFVSNLAGHNLLVSSIYQVYSLPARTVPGDLVIICAGSLLICVLAGVVPAFMASRLKPVEALRHE